MKFDFCCQVRPGNVVQQPVAVTSMVSQVRPQIVTQQTRPGVPVRPVAGSGSGKYLTKYEDLGLDILQYPSNVSRGVLNQ